MAIPAPDAVEVLRCGGICRRSPGLLRYKLGTYFRSTRTFQAALLAVALFALAACGQGRTSAEAPHGTEAVQGGGLLDFSAPAVGGGVIEGKDYSDRDVALWFWAPWCEVCNGEAPEVARLAQRNGSDIAFLGIAGRDSEGPMQDFVDKYALGFPQANDADGALWASFGVPAQPAWAFIDGETGESRTFLGPLPADQVEIQLDILRANNT